ncbi:hypothetical protein NPIL_304211 [Nephila pilipes]|uniref:Uncharacterized protein n=1 Tax=Nephila pilipes TaxID=299642 RepID=A0A8X6Q9C5_NEPPI|nr:hypothetical protein NPIL_304211 [Nephila pilipes]
MVTNHVNAYVVKATILLLIVFDVTFCGKRESMCRYRIFTFNHWSKMYYVFKHKGLSSLEANLTMSLADNQQTMVEAVSTQVVVNVERRSVLTRFITLLEGKRNRTLLGTDFLS